MQTLTRHGVGDAAAGLGLHFLHMSEGPFSHDASHISHKILKQFGMVAVWLCFIFFNLLKFSTVCVIREYRSRAEVYFYIFIPSLKHFSDFIGPGVKCFK